MNYKTKIINYRISIFFMIKNIFQKAEIMDSFVQERKIFQIFVNQFRKKKEKKEKN